MHPSSSRLIQDYKFALRILSDQAESLLFFPSYMLNSSGINPFIDQVLLGISTHKITLIASLQPCHPPLILVDALKYVKIFNASIILWES